MDISNIGLLVVLMASSLLNAGYFLPIFIRAFYPKNCTIAEAMAVPREEASMFMVVPLALTSLLSIAFGLYPDLWLRLIEVVK
jgi:multicomponent Na+:H+ antiporter subunit D